MSDRLPSRRDLNQRAIVREIADRALAVRTHPFEVQFSTEHRCNLKCVQCGATVERNRGIVPLMDRRLPVRAVERFKKLEHILPYFEWLSLTGSGEPLISPALPDILELLRGHECMVAFNTNGTLMTESRAAMIVDTGVDEIRFSIDGACQETFERIRVNASWDKVQSGIRTLVAQKRAHGSARPRIVFSSNFMRQNIEELPAIVDLAAELGAEQVIANNTIIYEPSMADEALVHHRALARRMVVEAIRRGERRGIDVVNQLHDLSGDEDGRDDHQHAPDAERRPRTDPLRSAGNGAIAPPTAKDAHAARAPAAPPAREGPGPAAAPAPRAASLSVESILPPLPGLPEDLPAIVHACQRPWTGLYVENDGWVKVCCFDSPPIGNLDQQSIDEIWNGPLVQDLRRSFLAGDPPEGCANCFIFAASQARDDVFVQEVKTGKSYIDAPGLDPSVSGSYLVHGWAIEPDGVDGVDVTIDGEIVGAAEFGHEREDVAAAFPGFPDGTHCGFRYGLDTAELPAADHHLGLRVRTRTGRVVHGVVRLIRVVR